MPVTRELRGRAHDKPRRTDEGLLRYQNVDVPHNLFSLAQNRMYYAPNVLARTQNMHGEAKGHESKNTTAHHHTPKHQD